MVLLDWLPQHLGRALPKSLAGLSVDESQLDCKGCSRGASKGCDFWPFVPNGNAAQSLAKLSSFQSKNLRDSILPIGIVASGDFQRRHRDPEQRGKLRCPYLSDRGLCSNWTHRPSECATYFCESQAGIEGQTFWQAMNQVTHFIEYGLAQLWMIEAGYDWSEVEKNLSLIVIEGEIESSRIGDEIWAHHANRKMEFFARAEAWARALSGDEIRDRLGVEFNRLLDAAMECHSLTSWGRSPRGTL